MDHTPLQIGRELRRIGVDERRLGALAVQGVTADALLRWLRWLPTDIGHAAFMERLERWADGGGLKAAVANDALPVAEPHPDGAGIEAVTTALNEGRDERPEDP